jgi:predicted MFS family arabinose efflux permease
VQLAAFFAMGIGFYTLHGCIQVEASELAATARGTAMALHSLFFFVGQATGPVLYGISFKTLGAGPAVLLGGGVMLLVAVMCAHYLGSRSPPAPAP